MSALSSLLYRARIFVSVAPVQKLSVAPEVRHVPVNLVAAVMLMIVVLLSVPVDELPLEVGFPLSGSDRLTKSARSIVEGFRLEGCNVMVEGG